MRIYQLPAGNADCPRHPTQPDGACPPCATRARLTAARAAAYTVACLMSALCLIGALTDRPVGVVLTAATCSTLSWIGWALIQTNIRHLDAAGK